MNIYERFQNYSELNNDRVIAREVNDAMMEYARNVSQFFRLLNWMNSRKEVVYAKTIEHAIYTEHTDTAVMWSDGGWSPYIVTTNAQALIVEGAHGTDGVNNSIRLDTADPHRAGDVIRLVGTGADRQGQFILLRLRGRNVGAGAGFWFVDVIDHNIAANQAAVEFTSEPAQVDTCVMHTCGNASPVDGEAPDGVFSTPVFVVNRLMRTRNSVTVGVYTLNDTLHSNLELVRQVFLRWFKVYQDIENSLLFSTTHWVESGLQTVVGFDSDQESMGFGGCMYYLRPHTLDPLQDLEGNNLPAELRGGAFSINIAGMLPEDFYTHLDSALRATTAFGQSDMKIMVGSPAVISVIHTVFRDLIVPTTVDFRFIGAPSLWDAHVLTMPSGKIMLLPSNGMTGKGIPIAGAAFTALEAARAVDDQTSFEFFFLLDPTVLNMPILSVDGVPQEITAKPADISQNNNSFKKVEIDGFYGFTIREPRACATVIIERI